MFGGPSRAAGEAALGPAGAALRMASGIWVGGGYPVSGFVGSVAGGVVVASETALKRGALDWSASPVAESPVSGFGGSVAGGVVVASETTLKRGAWDWGDSPVAESPVKGSCSHEGEGEDDVVALCISNGWIVPVSPGGQSGMDTRAMVTKGYYRAGVDGGCRSVWQSKGKDTINTKCHYHNNHIGGNVPARDETTFGGEQL